MIFRVTIRITLFLIHLEIGMDHALLIKVFNNVILEESIINSSYKKQNLKEIKLCTVKSECQS